MDKFQEEILAGIPQDRLPEPKPYDKTINHAPKRKDILTAEEKVLALKNALRYFPAKFHAELAPEFAQELKVFEGCMPVEVMARRGYDTLCYGPLKPVGLTDPRTGAHSFAVVQLRRENQEGTMYNLVGFQTHLTFPEQRRVFRLIPGLENAEFLRYGVMHRNTYLPSPDMLEPDYSVRTAPNVYFAGQMTGVEGYIESTGSGFVAGINAARRALGMEPVIFPTETMIGAMANYVSRGGIGDFTPMNANFGIVPLPEKKIKGGKLARNEALAARSLAWIDSFVADRETPES